MCGMQRSINTPTMAVSHQAISKPLTATAFAPKLRDALAELVRFIRLQRYPHLPNKMRLFRTGIFLAVILLACSIMMVRAQGSASSGGSGSSKFSVASFFKKLSSVRSHPIEPSAPTVLDHLEQHIHPDDRPRIRQLWQVGVNKGYINPKDGKFCFHLKEIN